MIPKDFIIIYGSQTGQAEAIAKQIEDRTIHHGYNPRVYCMSQTEKEFFIEKETFAVIIISSTGDGDPPEKSAKFMRRIGRKALPGDWLCHLNYSLLGLGDSNYSALHHIPKKLDKILNNLGGKKFIETGLADDQVGLELIVEPWIEKLLSKLDGKSDTEEITMSDLKITDQEEHIEEEITIGRGSEKLRNEQNLRVPQASLDYIISSVTNIKIEDYDDIPWQNNSKFPGQGSPFYEANVVGVIDITGTDIEGIKEKREIQLELIDGCEDLLKYEPGDSFYFIIPNMEDEVDLLLEKLNLLTIADQQLLINLNPDTKKNVAFIPDYLPNNASLRYIFTYCLDIRRSPGRPILRVLAEHCEDENEKRRLLELCSAQGMNEFNKVIRNAGVTLTDVLSVFPSCKPEVDRLLELLPRLIPRPYTASCHHSLWKNRVRFVYSLLNFPAEEGRQEERTGLATGFMKSLNVGDQVMVALKETSKFRLPPISIDKETDGYDIPLLMIGPGTGVAPFVGFLQKIYHLRKVKNDKNLNVPRYLFYGCRNLEKEFLYEQELKIFEEVGILTKLFVCESRPIGNDIKESEPRHVQDLLKMNKQIIIEFLKLSNSRIYLCGDGIGMSKDIFQCFVDIVKEGYSFENMEAITFINELKKNERYIEDVWT
uniref:Methionine synthase reductase n=1 Tax=Parastrongyloides trichosuri TaxID=131310 RepID=A0A0N4Z5B8_PARTI